ncbi:MAG: acyl-CoA dehydrogenase family protein [Parvularculaceae bacterium]|nr:acyl-CoA dehydrogenase family protein [Parvularculaceae bacterium]
MPHYRPRAHLQTHEVANQPPPFEDINLFDNDAALIGAVEAAGGEVHGQRLSDFGARCGSAEVLEWAQLANKFTPQLKSFDRFGHRLDEVEFHPAYHWLMELGLSAGVSAGAWTAGQSGHTLHAGLLFLMGQAEGGVCCPMSMTYAAVAALAHDARIAGEWVPRATAARYDSRFIPASEKSGVTIGMAMTEKQGGSDVRANMTRAERTGDSFILHGHKWFCSAPMCDAFLTLAYLDEGLCCFLVPRWKPNGERNAIHIMRLKDKLGDRANASSEIEFHGAYAELIGEPGRGVRTIIDMVQHTRLDCIVGSAGGMRAALANALWHAEHRSAFQKKLIDQPAMARVLADLAIDSEAATALAFRVARSFDNAGDDDQEAAFMRLATPVAKYSVCKRQPAFVYEALECHGGAGFIEEGVMARYFRASPLNAIWEGSGNVIALDVLRAISREQSSLEAVVADIMKAQGANGHYDRHTRRLNEWLEPGALNEGTARAFAEEMGLALQGAALYGVAPDFVFEAFCNARLNPDARSYGYGASDARFDAEALIARAAPF